MKINISTAESAMLLGILETMKKVHRKSAVIATLIGIDRHEISKIESLIKRFNSENPKIICSNCAKHMQRKPNRKIL